VVAEEWGRSFARGEVRKDRDEAERTDQALLRVVYGRETTMSDGFNYFLFSTDGVRAKTDQFSSLEVERAVLWLSISPVIAKKKSLAKQELFLLCIALF